MCDPTVFEGDRWALCGAEKVPGLGNTHLVQAVSVVKKNEDWLQESGWIRFGCREIYRGSDSGSSGATVGERCWLDWLGLNWMKMIAFGSVELQFCDSSSVSAVPVVNRGECLAVQRLEAICNSEVIVSVTSEEEGMA
ncbi:hypothetical protein F0562_030261 [Nyssa sinensis]|uniref:Uncharacterized protein n=1 Tax=Nyssa sinensis TaxID=561372 RepID=A0A5J5AYF8_9ASTE|nr:hypothetical protein F0562_030261 [Nyssa sinensis]